MLGIGCENKSTVCLQCHMDMVCQADDAITIDFSKDPIIPRIEGKYLKATHTSLGADDGIGVASCFAILADKTIKHGPLEVLVTRDEETGLYGASDLEKGILKAKTLINVDNEDENALCIGCAGGYNVEMKLPTIRRVEEGYVTRQVVLNNFLGGHSGCDIHLGRANPMHVMARLFAVCVGQNGDLQSLNCECYRWISLDCGTAHNAIPRKCTVNVAVKAECVECFEKKMNEAFAAFLKEYKPIEADATLTITPIEDPRTPCDLASTKRVVDFLMICPFGPMRYSPVVEGLVETSMTCAIAVTKNLDNIQFTASVRSSSKSQIDAMYRMLQSICEMVGMSLSEKIGEYPGWDPDANSKVTKLMAGIYEDLYKKAPWIYACHAGLECGLIMEKYPEMDCTSVGPEVNFPHSPDERCLISSVPPFLEVLKGTLDALE